MRASDIGASATRNGSTFCFGGRGAGGPVIREGSVVRRGEFEKTIRDVLFATSTSGVGPEPKFCIKRPLFGV